jgi:hypothetical protein
MSSITLHRGPDEIEIEYSVDTPPAGSPARYADYRHISLFPPPGVVLLKEEIDDLMDRIEQIVEVCT